MWIQNLLLIGMVILSVVEADLYLASFPSIATHLQTSVSSIQSSLNIYLLIFSFGVLFIGPISDRLGRKRTFLWALGFDWIGTLLALASSTISLFLVGRALQALGGCAGCILSRVIAKEISSEEKFKVVNGYLFVGVSTAIALSPVLGGLVEDLIGWQANFLILALFQLLLWLGIYRFIPETLPVTQLQGRTLGQKIKEVIIRKEFLYYASLISLVWSGVYVFIGASAFFLIERFGIPPAQYGVLFALMMGGMILGSSLSNRMDQLFRRSLWSGLIFLALGGILLLWPVNLTAFCLAMGSYLFGTGVLLPICQDRASRKGGALISLIFSLFVFAQMFTASTLCFLFAWGAPLSSMPYFVAFFALASILFYIQPLSQKRAVEGR